MRRLRNMNELLARFQREHGEKRGRFNGDLYPEEIFQLWEISEEGLIQAVRSGTAKAEAKILAELVMNAVKVGFISGQDYEKRRRYRGSARIGGAAR